MNWSHRHWIGSWDLASELITKLSSLDPGHPFNIRATFSSHRHEIHVANLQGGFFLEHLKI